MRLYISADIEGTCGIAAWSETEKNGDGYSYFSRQMSLEVASACRAALDSGKVDEVVVRDAHGTARNIQPELLPQSVRIIRGWDGAYGPMMAGLDDSFDIVAMTGYHSGAGAGGNPLSHTTNRLNHYIKINGEEVSEFTVNSLQASYMEIPVIFLSGDCELCKKAKAFNPGITTAPVLEGMGGASLSLHPKAGCELIYERMLEAIGKNFADCMVALPAQFQVEVEYVDLWKARKAGYYPNATQIDARRVIFESTDFGEVLRFFLFTL